MLENWVAIMLILFIMVADKLAVVIVFIAFLVYLVLTDPIKSAKMTIRDYERNVDLSLTDFLSYPISLYKRFVHINN